MLKNTVEKRTFASVYKLLGHADRASDQTTEDGKGRGDPFDIVGKEKSGFKSKSVTSKLLSLQVFFSLIWYLFHFSVNK